MLIRAVQIVQLIEIKLKLQYGLVAYTNKQKSMQISTNNYFHNKIHYK